MSFKAFAIRYKLDKEKYGILEKAKKYPFLDQEFLIDSDDEITISVIARQLCGEDTSLQKRFILGVEQLQKENNFIDVSFESDLKDPKNSIDAISVDRECKQEEIINDKEQNNNADDNIISIGMKRTRNNANIEDDAIKKPDNKIQNIAKYCLPHLNKRANIEENGLEYTFIDSHNNSTISIETRRGKDDTKKSHNNNNNKTSIEVRKTGDVQNEGLYSNNNNNKYQLESQK